MFIESFQILHGSVRDEDKYIVTQPDALRELRFLGTQLALFGYTHHQWGYFEGEDGYLQEAKPTFFRGCGLVGLELLPREKSILNSGSVGQPRDGDLRAAFCICDSNRQQVEYRRVPYSIEATQRRMEELGLLAPLIQRLSFGH